MLYRLLYRTLLIMIVFLQVSITKAFTAHKNPTHVLNLKKVERTNSFIKSESKKIFVVQASVRNDEEEKRLSMLASRRDSIRATLRNANSLKEFRLSNGESTENPLNSEIF